AGGPGGEQLVLGQRPAVEAGPLEHVVLAVVVRDERDALARGHADAVDAHRLLGPAQGARARLGGRHWPALLAWWPTEGSVALGVVTTTAAPPALMIDGRLVPAGDVARVVLDDGLVRGDGVFEGIRIYGRRPRTPRWHLDRLARSADTVGLAIDRALLEEELAAFCEATTAPDCAVRLIVTRGGQRVWGGEPVPPG